MAKYVIDCSAVKIGSYCFGKSHTVRGYRDNKNGKDVIMYNLRDVCNVLRVDFTPELKQFSEQYLYIKGDGGKTIEYGDAICAARIAASCKDEALRNKFFDFLRIGFYARSAA